MLKEEMETHICYVRCSDVARVDTFDPVVMHKLDSLVAKYPDVYRLVKEEEDSYCKRKVYEMPKKLLSYRAPMQPKVLSDDDIAAKRELLNRINSERRKNSAS